MHKVLLIGNPNVGKSTLFNSLTKQHAHTGNFHGVTVEETHKVVNINNEEYDIFDLPGIYSLNTVSGEEQVTKSILLSTKATRLMIVDANSMRKNLYLCLQLSELGFDYKILINNYDYFKKKKNKINFEKLNINLKINTQIINAKKQKLTNELLCNNNSKINCEYLKKYINIVKNKFNLKEKEIILAFNGEFSNLNLEQIKFIKSLYPDIIKDRYDFIDFIIGNSISTDKNYIYGFNKADRFLLNPFLMSVGFFVCFLLSLYAIFFLFGPMLSSVLSLVFEKFIFNPILNFLCLITDNIWIIEFFSGGVFASFLTVLSFVPQVCLLFVFLTILEDSGIISRMAYVFDELFSKFGLNGKAVYILLMGLGCNTMSAMATRNMNDKNLKIKTALINPYISCLARLPVFVLIASAFFGKMSYFVVAGLYLLGIIIAFVVSAILNKTILKSENSELLLEFPPLRHIDVKHIMQSAKINIVDFIKRVFSVVICVGVIVWILSHTRFDFTFTQSITDSILFIVADKISFIFAPIGLNNAGVICALIVGVMAKELIVSTMSICNNALSVAELGGTLLLTTSVIHFSLPSAVSFLLFSLLYAPCVSTLAVLRKETDKFFMWLSVMTQFTIAYLISFVAYQSLINGVIVGALIVLIISIIAFSIFFIVKKIKHKKCLTCGNCKF